MPNIYNLSQKISQKQKDLASFMAVHCYNDTVFAYNLKLNYSIYGNQDSIIRKYSRSCP